MFLCPKEHTKLGILEQLQKIDKLIKKMLELYFRHGNCKNKGELEIAGVGFFHFLFGTGGFPHHMHRESVPKAKY